MRYWAIVIWRRKHACGSQRWNRKESQSVFLRGGANSLRAILAKADGHIAAKGRSRIILRGAKIIALWSTEPPNRSETRNQANRFSQPQHSQPGPWRPHVVGL